VVGLNVAAKKSRPRARQTVVFHLSARIRRCSSCLLAPLLAVLPSHVPINDLAGSARWHRPFRQKDWLNASSWSYRAHPRLLRARPPLPDGIRYTSSSREGPACRAAGRPPRRLRAARDTTAMATAAQVLGSALSSSPISGERQRPRAITTSARPSHRWCGSRSTSRSIDASYCEEACARRGLVIVACLLLIPKPMGFCALVTVPCANLDANREPARYNAHSKRCSPKQATGPGKRCALEMSPHLAHLLDLASYAVDSSWLLASRRPSRAARTPPPCSRPGPAGVPISAT